MAGIIISWSGTLVSIPSPWSLCDGNGGRPNLLGKYLKGSAASTNPGSTGGATTHTHTSDAHNHTQDGHTHSTTTDVYGSKRGQTTGSGNAGAGEHSHSVSVASTTATNQTTAVSVNSVSNDPPYYKLAFIYDNGSSDYPIGSIIVWSGVTAPIGWEICISTPDLRNKFIKCVDAAEDPGSSGGSSNSHTHTTVAHGHTQDPHTHSGSSGASSSGIAISGSATTVATSAHTHDITVGSVTATNQNTTATIQNGDGQPAYKKLFFIKNTTSPNRPVNGIVVWTGTLASIPSGYVLCDGTNSTPDLRGYFIKGASVYTELETTGGSVTHGHTADSHGHTQNSHSHTITVASGGGSGGTGLGDTTTVTPHTHTCSDVTGVATNQGAVITVNASNSEPPYYEVAYIMQTRALSLTGANLLGMLI